MSGGYSLISLLLLAPIIQQKANSTHMLVVHAGPRLISSSLSLDVRQLSSKSCASLVGSGAITREAKLPDDRTSEFMSGRHASTTSDSGTKRKCTSSGALGSRMFPFSRAYITHTALHWNQDKRQARPSIIAVTDHPLASGDRAFPVAAALNLE